MAESFDPYYKWLGIPPSEQPATYYRLLSISPFESDPEVIDNAANRQLMMVRTFQGGKHSEISQRILNEITTARITLINAEKRNRYDKQLRSHLQKSQAKPARRAANTMPTAQPVAQPVGQPIAQPVTAMQQFAAQGVAPAGTSRPRQSLSQKTGLEPWVLMTLAGAGGLVVVLLLLFTAMSLLTPASGELVAFELNPAASGSRVFVDGEELSLIDRRAELRLSAGTHSLKVQHGARQHTRDFTVKDGSNPPLLIDAPMPTAAPPASGGSDIVADKNPSTAEVAAPKTAADGSSITPGTEGAGVEDVATRNANEPGSGDSSPGTKPLPPVRNTLPGNNADGQPVVSGNVEVRMGEPWIYHVPGISQVQQSPDGSMLVTHGANTVKLWSYPGGKLFFETRFKEAFGHPHFVKGGQSIVVCNRAGQLAWIDTATGKATQGHKIPYVLDDVAETTEGRILGVCHDTKNVHLVNLETGATLFSIDLLTPINNRIPGQRPRLVDNGAYLTCYRDSVLEIWDLATFTEKRIKLHAKGRRNSLTRAAKGTRVVISSEGQVSVLDCATGEEIAKARNTYRGIDCAAISPDGRIVAIAVSRRTIVLWDIETGHEFKPLEASYWVQHLRFTNDGAHLLAGNKAVLQLYDVRTSEEVEVSKPFPPRGKIFSLHYSPDGKILAAANYDGVVRFWNSATGQHLYDSDPGDVPRSRFGTYVHDNFMSFESNGRYLLSAASRQIAAINFWNPQNGRPVQGVLANAKEVTSGVALSPDGNYLVGSKIFGGVIGYDLRTGKQIKLPELKGRGCPGSFAVDSNTLAIADSANIIFWDIQQSREIDRIEVKSVATLTFAADNRSLLVGTYNLKTNAGQPVRSANGLFNVRFHDATSLDYSNAAQTYAVSRNRLKNVVEIWQHNAAGPKLQIRTRPFEGSVVAIAPDGKHVATAGESGAITVRKIP